MFHRKLSSDMEATRAALESERKLQLLQMQAISALWKKVTGPEVIACEVLCEDDQKHNLPIICEILVVSEYRIFLNLIRTLFTVLEG
jgi:hypothetical protein